MDGRLEVLVSLRSDILICRFKSYHRYMVKAGHKIGDQHNDMDGKLSTKWNNKMLILEIVACWRSIQSLLLNYQKVAFWRSIQSCYLTSQSRLLALYPAIATQLHRVACWRSIQSLLLNYHKVAFWRSIQSLLLNFVESPVGAISSHFFYSHRVACWGSNQSMLLNLTESPVGAISSHCYSTITKSPVGRRIQSLPLNYHKVACWAQDPVIATQLSQSRLLAQYPVIATQLHRVICWRRIPSFVRAVLTRFLFIQRTKLKYN
ncbi:hypothetical protein PoB_002780000 [Plakobranchus ocellatus]|uniref:Uncharacterized protein n=1 Tax=Plakobranchus ocellatus TaxID=259542 RepID=A0AAV4A1K2_9GAST|nr:hypothetical protein PoB_002780000 [Plakobranchus ocellatus]